MSTYQTPSMFDSAHYKPVQRRIIQLLKIHQLQATVRHQDNLKGNQIDKVNSV